MVAASHNRQILGKSWFLDFDLKLVGQHPHFVSHITSHGAMSKVLRLCPRLKLSAPMCIPSMGYGEKMWIEPAIAGDGAGDGWDVDVDFVIPNFNPMIPIVVILHCLLQPSFPNCFKHVFGKALLHIFWGDKTPWYANHIFPIISISWEFHHPNWRTHIFQRARYTTNQIPSGNLT